MTLKNKGYIVPVAIAVLVLASLGLLLFSWWVDGQKTSQPVANAPIVASTTVNTSVAPAESANDDAALNTESANIDTQLKSLDSSNSDINSSLNDSSSI